MYMVEIIISLLEVPLCRKTITLLTATPLNYAISLKKPPGNFTCVVPINSSIEFLFSNHVIGLRFEVEIFSSFH